MASSGSRSRCPSATLLRTVIRRAARNRRCAADLLSDAALHEDLPMDHGVAQSLPAYRCPAADVVAALGSDVDQGLTQSEAEARLRQYGQNELAEQPRLPVWRGFLRQFNDILVLLLLVAAAISGGLWLWEQETALPYEALTIFAIVLLNALMGYWQQFRAERAVAALRQISAARARVVRDGAVQMIAAARLVPGDIVEVEEGDIAPADGRLLRSAALQANEAALTGESLPVVKQTAAIDHDVPIGDRLCMIFSGTTITYGHAKAVVTATGMETRMGRKSRPARTRHGRDHALAT